MIDSVSFARLLETHGRDVSFAFVWELTPLLGLTIKISSDASAIEAVAAAPATPPRERSTRKDRSVRSEVEDIRLRNCVDDLRDAYASLRWTRSSTARALIVECIECLERIIASGTLTEGGDVEQAPSDSLSGPTGNAGDAQ